jgi:hypothetical protein
MKMIITGKSGKADIKIVWTPGKTTVDDKICELKLKIAYAKAEGKQVDAAVWVDHDHIQNVMTSKWIIKSILDKVTKISADKEAKEYIDSYNEDEIVMEPKKTEAKK